MPHTPSLCLGLILAIPRVWSLMLPKEKMRGLGGGGGVVVDFRKQRLVIKCSLWQALHFGGRGLKMAREKIEEGKWGIEDSPCSPISSLPTPTPLPFSLPNAEALILTFVLTTFQVG